MGDRLARRWERLPGAAQFGIALPICVLVLWWGHVALLNQPVGRGLLYGIFWGVLLSLLIVFASSNEARKRREREQQADAPPDELPAAPPHVHEEPERR